MRVIKYWNKLPKEMVEDEIIQCQSEQASEQPQLVKVFLVVAGALG